MVDSLCARATAAYFANRLLLTHVSAPRGRRVRMFNSLVTASLRWSLCVASVNQVNLRKLRVHHVTLLAWMLGARRHPSWFVVQCIAALRHAVKLWAWVYAERWDLLLARMVWKWVGHVLRFPADHVVRQTLLGCSILRYHGELCGASEQAPTTVAIEMFFTTFITMGSISPQLVIAWHGNLWNMIGLLLMDCPLTGYLARIYFQFPLSLSCGRRCLQGSFHGQQVFACDVSDPGYAITLELDRFSGWRGQRGDQSIAALLQNVADTGWIRPGTFHVKMLLFARQFPSERLSGLLALTPFCFDAFSAPCIVAEISMLPVVWLGDMTRLATELGR